MKHQHLRGTVAAGAAALLLAACGGGSGGGTAPGVDISGTAATGKALAGATVTVKCAAGSGTGTTTATGTYKVSIDNGALPCVVKVSGSSGGVSVVLHSAVESGTSAGNRTSATAHATPVTELVLAQLLAALPEDAFASLDPNRINGPELAAALQAVANALKTAGVDLAGTDAFKGALVPANGGTQGNAYDQLLDLLATKVSLQSLPLVANQIAVAAAMKSDTGLQQAVAAVSGGTLANCPYALSGNYRTIDYAGLSAVRNVDFQNGKFFSANGVDFYAITPNANNACEFSATGTIGSVTSTFDVVIGASGAGAYRVQNSGSSTASTVGYIFPVQPHAVADVDGTWTFVQSGSIGGTWSHSPGQFAFNASQATASECDYDPSTWNCVPEGSSFTLAARTDGGVDVNVGTSNAMNLWAYRAPSGATGVFGTTNAAGSGTAPQQTNIVASKLSRMALPAVGAVTNYWDMELDNIGTTFTSVAPNPQTTTILTVDSTTGKVTRKRTSDGREDVVDYNNPIEGTRTREASTWNGVPFATAHMFTLTGLGVNVSIDAFTTAPHFYVISVNRP